MLQVIGLEQSGCVWLIWQPIGQACLEWLCVHKYGMLVQAAWRCR